MPLRRPSGTNPTRRDVVIMTAALATGCAPLGGTSAAHVPPPAQARFLRVATHNVHYIRAEARNGPWSLKDWQTRKHSLDAAFKALDADLVAFQEMVSLTNGNDRSQNHARDWLLTQNPDYGLAASGDWRSFPTRQPILFRTSRLRLVSQGWFPFPDLKDGRDPGAWLGKWVYYAAWAEFANLQGQRFAVYNIHLHYSHRLSRRASGELLATRVAADRARGLPVLVMGDSNSFLGTPALTRLQAAGLRFVDANGATYHVNRGINIVNQIDQIGYSDGLAPARGPWALRSKFEGKWPSDHYPVAVDFALRRPA